MEEHAMNRDRSIWSVLLLILVPLALAPSALAECVDWGSVPLVTPVASWDGAAYGNVAGGSLVGGFLQKLDTSVPGLQTCRYYDVRDPLQPTLVDEVSFTLEFSDGEFIAATSDALCAVGHGNAFGIDYRFIDADAGAVHYGSPLSGALALRGRRLFQTAIGWMDGVSGLGCYDATDPADISAIGFFAGAADSGPGPFVLADDVALVGIGGAQVQVIDFSVPSAPVARGAVVSAVTRWLGRDGDIVYFSTSTQMCALDVSDLDHPLLAFTIPGRVGGLSLSGDLAVLRFGNSIGQLQIHRLRGPGAPAAVSGLFGTHNDYPAVWSGDVVYDAGHAAYDVSDPSTPTLIGDGSATAARGLEVRDGWLVTGHGPFPLHCDAAAPVPGAPLAGALAAWPNPFNPRVEISFAVDRSGPARLEIHDVRGGHVCTLLDGTLAAGPTTATWDGRDESGLAAPAGVYCARLTVADGVREVKVTLLK